MLLPLAVVLALAQVPIPILDTVATDSIAVADSVQIADSLAAAAPSPPRDYLAEIRDNFGPESRAYWGTRTALAFLEPLTTILIALLVLFSGLSAKLRDIAEVMGRSRWVRLLVFFTLYTLVVYLLTFPLAWYGGFALEHQYGLSNQSLGAWLGEQGKELVVGIVFLGVTPIVWLVYRALEASPRRWWLWLALGTLPIVTATVLLQPLLIDPLFNKFTPLRDQQLESRIVALAERAGIPGRNVYEVDKSRQTRKFNAYVNGFGVSQRIVLWDTILEGMETDEILFVMGHEMGHYRLGHIWKGIAFATLTSFAFFWVVALIVGWALRRFGTPWGIRALHDPASLPLLSATLTLVVFLSQPITNGYSRSIETEADVYALEITRDNDGAARAFLKLGAQNRSNPAPPPWIRFLFYSHPTLAERVTLALGYRPWQEGKPNRLYRGSNP